MAQQTCECECWICVDAEGQYAVGSDEASAREKYTEDVGDLSEVDGFRLVKVSLTVPLPKPIELSGVVAAEETASMSVA